VALVVAAVIGGTAGITFAGSHGSRTVIEADVLVGVSRPYTGAANAIRGVPGGGRPWVIAKGEVELKSNGKLKVEVEGLVIDPNEPIAAAGTNPAATFKAIVSCLSTDATGAAVTTNVSSAEFPADPAGNSEFETSVMLPRPCIAPIVFVANAGGSWFAATGV
jgi:hypothetical protein